LWSESETGRCQRGAAVLAGQSGSPDGLGVHGMRESGVALPPALTSFLCRATALPARPLATTVSRFTGANPRYHVYRGAPGLGGDHLSLRLLTYKPNAVNARSLREPERGENHLVSLGLIAGEGSRSESNIVDQAIALEEGRFAESVGASKPVLQGYRVHTVDRSSWCHGVNRSASCLQLARHLTDEVCEGQPTRITDV
jgi:hypothetical protein